MEHVRSAAVNYFSFIDKPCEDIVDRKAMWYCLPVFRDVMRISTAFRDIEQNSVSKVDIAKWAITWFISSQITIPYIGTLSKITTVAALGMTVFAKFMQDPVDLPSIVPANQH